MTGILRAWGPAAIWAALLFILSSIPATGASWLPVSDKVVHFALYAVLGALLARGARTSSGRPAHALLLALGVAYGLSDEWHQTFVPGRDASAGDLVADTLGVVAGYLIVLGLYRRWAPRYASSTDA